MVQVLIIDNSGSMGIPDVPTLTPPPPTPGRRNRAEPRSNRGHIMSHITRHDAVFDAIQTGLIAPQLAAGVGPHDVLSLVLFSCGAGVLLKHMPFADAEAGLSYFRNHYPPVNDGTHYIAALAALRDLLAAQGPCTFTAVNVLFFSDGQPTDHLRSLGGRAPNGQLLGAIVKPSQEELLALERDVVRARRSSHAQCCCPPHALPTARLRPCALLTL